MEAAFLQALHADPNDEATWLALTDWLEEDGQADRADLVRLTQPKRAREKPPETRNVSPPCHKGRASSPGAIVVGLVRVT
jgi:uncharacterized protein (TIGR02996 family)